jgi:hypothetical protein
MIRIQPAQFDWWGRNGEEGEKGKEGQKGSEEDLWPEKKASYSGDWTETALKRREAQGLPRDLLYILRQGERFESAARVCRGRSDLAF